MAAATVKALACPEARLPAVYPHAPAAYQHELTVLQQQRGGVSPGHTPSASTLGGTGEGRGPPSLPSLAGPRR